MQCSYKVLITGANGQLGSEIKDISVHYPYEFIFTSKEYLDITDFKSVHSFFEANKIDFVINCAAYTAVDRAETDIENVVKLNFEAVKNLALITREHKSKLVHISTDFVFDGKKNTPYTENDDTNPLSIYGKSKLSGEEAISHNADTAVIIRTSWLYSKYGNNFVKTIIRHTGEKGCLRVVYDQIGTPTYARDLARTILDILPKIRDNNIEIYHYSNEGTASWYDFAQAIVELTNTVCAIEAIETKNYPTQAERPRYSVLNKKKIKSEFDMEIPYWRDSLRKCIKRLGVVV